MRAGLAPVLVVCDRMVSGAPVAGSEFVRVMTQRSWVAVALALIGCTHDHTAICERLAECKLFPDGYSKDSCEQELSGESDLESCRDCVEETACENIVEECRNECVLK